MTDSSLTIPDDTPEGTPIATGRRTDPGSLSPTVIVNYGPGGRYVVEFAMSGDKLMARYLPSPDGIGRSIPEAWEERAPAVDDDAERVALLAALRTVLTTWW